MTSCWDVIIRPQFVRHMAKVEPALPFDHFSGKLSSKEHIVMRTRNGRTHAYAIQNLTPDFLPRAANAPSACSPKPFASVKRRCPIPTVSPIGKTVASNTAKPLTNTSPVPTPNSSAQPPTSSIAPSAASSLPLFLPD